MSRWSDLDLTNVIEGILRDVHANNLSGHHFGGPYVTAYQIAIELERRSPDLVTEIGKQIGGAGIGEHNSLAQYLSNELSKNIKSDPSHFPIEGIFMSNENVSAMIFNRANGEAIQSSLVGTTFDIALYRLRRSL